MNVHCTASFMVPSKYLNEYSKFIERWHGRVTSSMFVMLCDSDSVKCNTFHQVYAIANWTNQNRKASVIYDKNRRNLIALEFSMYFWIDGRITRPHCSVFLAQIDLTPWFLWQFARNMLVINTKIVYLLLKSSMRTIWSRIHMTLLPIHRNG